MVPIAMADKGKVHSEGCVYHPTIQFLPCRMHSQSQVWTDETTSLHRSVCYRYELKRHRIIILYRYTCPDDAYKDQKQDHHYSSAFRHHAT